MTEEVTGEGSTQKVEIEKDGDASSSAEEGKKENNKEENSKDENTSEPTTAEPEPYSQEQFESDWVELP